MAKTRWNEYPKIKPKVDGFYICTVHYEEKNDIDYLYYFADADLWVDLKLRYVFNTYQVFRSVKGLVGQEVLEQVNGRNIWVKDNVIAFKNRPKIYK